MVGEILQQLSSDGVKAALPIERLKVHGNHVGTAAQLGSAPQIMLKPPMPPASPLVLPVSQPTAQNNQSAATDAGTPQTPSSKPTPMVRRFEFIRRSLTRSDKSNSPTFVIEGKKVKSKYEEGNKPPSDISSEEIPVDNDKIFHDTKSVKSAKLPLPPRKSESLHSFRVHALPNHSSAMSVVLPVLHIGGPGFSHQLRSKSTSIPDDQAQTDTEDMHVGSEAPSGPPESIWSELENLDNRLHKGVKRNNFFLPSGQRINEDLSELCVDNMNKAKTITLQLQTNHKTKTAKHNKTPRERLFTSRSQNQGMYGSHKHLFNSVDSYVHFNSKGRAALYSSDQYLNSNQAEGILKSMENQRASIPKRLVAKYSDVAIQKDLNDFMKIKGVK